MDGLIDEDDFGLSSSDEAALLDIDENTSPSNNKRKHDNNSRSFSKRARTEVNESPARGIANKVLRERFKIDAFRLKQEEAITRLLNGGSSVVIFPTGGGKSLCYQVPALCFREMDRLAGIRQGHAESGITLVVSPLIALMKDQVDALHRRGISAAVLDSTKTKEEYLRTVDSMRDGTLDILYCAPERLNNEGFVASMGSVKGGVRLLAVDEAHCISEWGHAFRPDYLKVARFAKEIQAERVVCLTATATPAVAKDVRKAFDIAEEGLFRTSTYRPNLKLRAESYDTKKESYAKLIPHLKNHPGPTIVYVTTHAQAEDLALKLSRVGFSTKAFHAGMKAEEKTAIQEAFMRSDDLIICATIAFGMGIDKSNIRNVVHHDIPKSLESYSQEIGRAGRDGLESTCMFYLCAEDLHLRESFARGDLPSKQSTTGLLLNIFGGSTVADGVIEVNHSPLSREYDVTPTTLGNIMAQLELRFGLLRATTPKYTKYQYKVITSTGGDRSPAGMAINKHAKAAKTWTHVDVDTASFRSGLPRSELVAKLNDWNDNGHIELQAAGVVNIYRVLDPKSWPPSPKKQSEIVDALYKDLVHREQQELNRIQQVMDLITKEQCFAFTLTKHFGDTLPNDAQECGHCTWCESKTAVAKVSRPRKPLDKAAFNKVLAACKARDNPRYLARIAFGIRSPRATAEKLSNHAAFGSMEDHDFMTLLKAFEAVCNVDE